MSLSQTFSPFFPSLVWCFFKRSKPFVVSAAKCTHQGPLLSLRPRHCALPQGKAYQALGGPALKLRFLKSVRGAELAFAGEGRGRRGLCAQGLWSSVRSSAITCEQNTKLTLGARRSQEVYQDNPTNDQSNNKAQYLWSWPF
uniref:Uncharacterized protein n=1 Tax=Caulerpa lentillifera TaxID=148947 RepID=A0A2Z2QKF2_9CHLO|nr:hypothetical protein [Caulerpa lentillifera]AST24223.1 hypothetical protein [Caulerpa lentillifera]